MHLILKLDRGHLLHLVPAQIQHLKVHHVGQRFTFNVDNGTIGQVKVLHVKSRMEGIVWDTVDWIVGKI